MKPYHPSDEDADYFEEIFAEENDDYRPLDFNDNSLFDRRLTPSLEEEINGVLARQDVQGDLVYDEVSLDDPGVADICDPGSSPD